jgi:hypothetical protein
LPTAGCLYNAIRLARKMNAHAGMSLGFMIAACAFALVLGGVVAWVDWWREARRLTPRPRAAMAVSADVKPHRTAEHRRAA